MRIGLFTAAQWSSDENPAAVLKALREQVRAARDNGFSSLFVGQHLLTGPMGMFQTNPLTRAGALEVCGTPIDLKQVTCDFFCVAGTTDHITPWDSCYKSAHLFGGKCEFVLSNSGHIQSILNPPGNPKARYMTNSEMPADPKAWQEGSTKHADSWWLHWQSWLAATGDSPISSPSQRSQSSGPPSSFSIAVSRRRETAADNSSLRAGASPNQNGIVGGAPRASST